MRVYTGGDKIEKSKVFPNDWILICLFSLQKANRVSWQDLLVVNHLFGLDHGLVGGGYGRRGGDCVGWRGWRG